MTAVFPGRETVERATPLGPARPQPAVYEVCGVQIAALEPMDAAEYVAQRAVAGTGLQAHLCNAYTLSLVDSDPKLAGALAGADLNLPDGTPVAWLGRRLGIRGPVRGPGLVGDVADLGRRYGLKHYLYGGAEGTAEAMADRLRSHAPGVEIVACETPPFRDLTAADLDSLGARLMGSGAHVVWVGLGTPRQDYVVPEIAARFLGAVVPVGAAFDFWAGTVKQAPKALHGTGLEWLYRLVVEPRRLWRRYLVGNPKFVASAARHRRAQSGGAS